MDQLTKITTAWINPRNLAKLQNNLSDDISDYIFFFDDTTPNGLGLMKLGEAKIQITLENKNLLLSAYTNKLKSTILEKKEAIERINKKLDKLHDVEKEKFELCDEIKKLEAILESSKNIF